jgi:hypothetical protein
VKSLGRVISTVLVLPVGVGLIVGGGSHWHAVADDSVAGDDCITNYHAQGWTLAVGEGLEIPAENVAGEPYVLGGLIDQPVSHARASSGYPGYIGEAVYSLASDKAPPWPEEAEAFYPKPSGGFDADAHDYGPLMYSKAITKPTSLLAEASVGSVGALPGVGNVGPALAHVDQTYDGQSVHGLQQAVAYDVAVGPLHIGQMTSVLKWTNDGTDHGTSESWTVKFHNVEANGQVLSSGSGDGFSFQGGQPQPGPQAREQTVAAIKQLDDALMKAGVGAIDIHFGPARHDVSAGHIDINGSAVTIRLADEAKKGTIGQAASLQFGRTQLEVLTGRGPCDNAKEANNSYKPGDLPTGPNVLLTPEPESAHWMPGLPVVATSGAHAATTHAPSAMPTRVQDAAPTTSTGVPPLPVAPLAPASPVVDTVRRIIIPALPPPGADGPGAPVQQPDLEGGGGLMR